MKKATSLLLLFFLAYLLFYPAPIDPIAVTYPRKEISADVPTTQLNDAEIRFPRLCTGCEDVAIDPNGQFLISGREDGELLYIPLDPSADRATTLHTFDSRPLGLDLVGDSVLYVAVEADGLFRLNLPDGEPELLASEYGGNSFLLTDDLDAGPDGKVYFTDATNRYSDEDKQLDLLSLASNGALYMYEPSSGSTERLLDDLHFANGVAVAPDGSYLLVNETSAFRTWRVQLTGPEAGRKTLFIEGLPGWPDGISLGTDGLYYLPLISPRTNLHDFILPRPWTRRVLTKLPRFLWPAPEPGNRILVLDESGTVVHQYVGEDMGYNGIASVERVGDRLWCGSLYADGILTILGTAD